MKIDRLIVTLVALGMIFVFLGICYMVVDMLIDHNCYQLEPNDRYEKTICEKYWSSEEKNISQGRSKNEK